MVKEEVPDVGGLTYEAMETALREDKILPATREKVRALLADEKVVSLFRDVEQALRASRNWRKIQFAFFEILADVAGDPPDVIKA